VILVDDYYFAIIFLLEKKNLLYPYLDPVSEPAMG